MTQPGTRGVMAALALRPRPRRGAGLIEILLAMVIFAAIATSYAAVTLRYATRMKTISTGAARSAAIMEYANRLMAIPFDSAHARNNVCVTTSTGSFPNTRCIRVYTMSTTKDSIKIIVTPTNTTLKPDTVRLWRVKASVTSPLG